MAVTSSKWLLFILLSLIWGSSFILIKIGLEHLNAVQVASIRILSAGIVMLPFAFRAWRRIPKQQVAIVIVSGVLGNVIPAFLYCIAELHIHSSLASIFNALTPLCAIVIGVAFFQLNITRAKIAGVLLGLAGLVLLPFAAEGGVDLTNLGYAALVLLATICYGTNVHIISRYLRHFSSIDIASLALSCFILPCIAVLVFTGFFTPRLVQEGFAGSVLASCVLGVFGTALASVWFYALVKTAGSIFASLVTYGIPFIAVGWGLLFGEPVTLPEMGCLLLILAGVYLVNRSSVRGQ